MSIYDLLIDLFLDNIFDLAQYSFEQIKSDLRIIVYITWVHSATLLLARFEVKQINNSTEM